MPARQSAALSGEGWQYTWVNGDSDVNGQASHRSSRTSEIESAYATGNDQSFLKFRMRARWIVIFLPAHDTQAPCIDSMLQPSIFRLLMGTIGHTQPV
jgi:hypothetical protein